MRRVNLTGSTNWFDIDSASSFDEDSRWDGRNWISKATGSHTEHERLYVTKSGRYVLNCWSQWQGVPETFTLIDLEEAAEWLLRNLEYEAAERLMPGILEKSEV